jgi:uncharacterized protein (DUF849 family)
LTTIITCAITGLGTTLEQTPYLPITPEQIATSALEAAEAGASVVHLHVRNPETGNMSMELDLYRDTVDRIKKFNQSVLINLTTGPGSYYVPGEENLAVGSARSLFLSAEVRTRHIEVLKPDLCSIDFNVMQRSSNGVTINYKPIVKEMLERVQRVGTKPELEIFDSGDYCIAHEYITDGTIKGTPFWQFAMGIKYGWGANIDALLYAYRLLPSNSIWSAFGIGRSEMPIVAHTAAIGGHVRVGLEDNIYLRRGELAKTNAELVKMAADIVQLIGGTVATPNQARQILLN